MRLTVALIPVALLMGWLALILWAALERFDSLRAVLGT